MRNKMSVREQFRYAYRLARQPDMYLADDVDGVNRFYLEVPLRYFLDALKCLENRGVK